MFNLLDIARGAQGGAGFDSLSRQFGLNGDQTRRVVEGLLPAFSLALRRNAQDPSAFGAFLQLMTSGRYEPAFDASPMVFAMGGGADGQDILGQLFGAEHVSRAVASQVSATTGVGLAAVQQIMPALAGALVGGLYRQAATGGYADFLRQGSDMLRSATPKPARSSPAWDPWSAWSEMVAAMTPAKKPEPPPPAPNPLAPWTDMMGAMWGAPAKPEPPPPPPPNPFQAVAEMFESGREVQAQHLARLQAILDGVWGRAP